MATNDSNTYEAAQARHVPGSAFISAALRPGPNTYAVKAVGDCLSPVYDDGDVLACDPDAALAVGDYVAIWWKDGRQPMVKRLTMGVPAKESWQLKGLEWWLCCEQHNPPRDYEFSSREVEAVHKVLGKARQAAAQS